MTNASVLVLGITGLGLGFEGLGLGINGVCLGMVLVLESRVLALVLFSDRLTNASVLVLESRVSGSRVLVLFSDD